MAVTVALFTPLQSMAAGLADSETFAGRPTMVFVAVAVSSSTSSKEAETTTSPVSSWPQRTAKAPVTVDARVTPLSSAMSAMSVSSTDQSTEIIVSSLPSLSTTVAHMKILSLSSSLSRPSW